MLMISLKIFDDSLCFFSCVLCVGVYAGSLKTSRKVKQKIDVGTHVQCRPAGGD